MVAITPVRVLDTRNSNGGHPSQMQPGEEIQLQILGRGAVPDTAASVQINITVVVAAQPSGSYLIAWPTGRPRPTASNINWNPTTVTQALANHSVVQVGTGGRVSFYNGAPYPIHLVVDVQGWEETEPLVFLPPAAPLTQTPTFPGTADAGQVLRNTVQYAMTTWWDTVAPGLLAATIGQSDPGDVARRLAMQAHGIATAVALDCYDPATAGQPAAVAASRVATMVDRVASQHMLYSSGGWGETWQSPMFAAIAGRAAWWIWGQIPGPTQQKIGRVVQFEANYAARQAHKYYRGVSGGINSPGDTGAEEMSWRLEAIQLALSMLPNDRMWSTWLRVLPAHALASVARPADVTSTEVVNGRALADWVEGSNVEADGSLVNHSRVAPDYSVAVIYQLLSGALTANKAGLMPLRALKWGLAPLYGAFQNVIYVSPPAQTPGGTVYVPDSGQIYWPGGNEWGTGQVMPFALADGLALCYGFDNGNGQMWLARHLAAVLAQQNRHTDRHCYASPAEYNYPGAEEHTSLLASLLYDHLVTWEFDPISFSDSAVYP